MDNQNTNQNLFTMDDIWNEKDKNEPADCTKTYDPQYFWDNFGEKYFQAHEKREMFQFGLNGNNPVAWLIFKLRLLKIDTVLEVGCGFGRLAPFIIDSEAAKEYHGIDISEKILECHKEYMKDYPKKDHVHMQKASARKMPFSDNSMDCVISSETLSYMNRTKAEHCLREMIRVASKYVVLIERFVYNEEHPYPHMWSHDWLHMLSNVGLTPIESKMIGNGLQASICRI